MEFISIFGTFVVAIFPLVFLYRRYFCRLAQLRLPGPNLAPFIGDIVDFCDCKFQFHLLLDAYYKRYGKLFAFYHQGQPVIVAADDSIRNQILLKHNSSFCNRKFFYPLPEPCHQMITMMKSPQNNKTRMLLKTVLEPENLKKAMKHIKSAAVTMQGGIEKSIENGVDVVSFSDGYVMEILTKVAFSLDVPNQSKLNKTLVNLTSSFCRAPDWVNVLAGFPLGRYLVHFIPAAFSNQLNALKDIALNVVKDRRKEENSTKEDILAALLSAQQQDAKITDNVILAQGLVLLTAVHKSTSTTLALSLYHIAKDASMQEKLFAEIESLSSQADFPTFEHVTKELQYLDNIVNEVIRLYPSGFMLTRECVKPITINNINFKQGDMVIIPTYSIQRDDELYTNANVFNPDRFDDKKQSEIPTLAFGAGVRGCLGKQMAITELKVAIIQLVGKFKFSTNLNDVEESVDLHSYFTIQAMFGIEKPIKINATPRS